MIQRTRPLFAALLGLLAMLMLVLAHGPAAPALAQSPTKPPEMARARGTIELGQTITATMQRVDGDYWNLSMEAGQSVFIFMYSEEFDTLLELYDGFDTFIDWNDDYDGLNSGLFFTADTTGTYRIRAWSYRGDVIGEYTLVVVNESAQPETPETPEAPEDIVVVPAYDYDTYPGGYQVTVYRYEIDRLDYSVRLYFDATATQTDLRTPQGTYLRRSDGSTVYPIDSEWDSEGLTHYFGWFEFELTPFVTGEFLELAYCGCGFYAIPLSDLSQFLSGVATVWDLVWDAETVPCGSGSITYYDFMTNLLVFNGGDNILRETVGGAGPIYERQSDGTYLLREPYYDLDAYVLNEIISPLEDGTLRGQRIDQFDECTITVNYTLYLLD